MNEKLNIITEKLYNDGLVKAKEEAENILLDAKKQAEGIIEKANKDAEKKIVEAKKESADLKHKVEAELRLGAEQAVAAIKQRIVSLVSDDISSNISSEAFKDNEFVENLILTVAEKWKSDEGVYDLNLILSEDLKKETENFFSSKAKTLLDNGLSLDFKANDTKGFVLRPQDGSYQINFTDEVFNNFFADYLRGFTKKLLFDN
ncbi:MAG: V-type ATP synthase subunit E [Marinifilaceae bacterium]